MSNIAEQTTVARAVQARGVGLHTGAEAALALLPAAADTGVVFVTGSGAEVPALAEFVVDTTRATALGQGGACVRAVEHLLAALYALGIDNVRLEIDGPEAPAGDGSARDWAALVRQAGVARLGRPRKTGALSAPVWQREGDSWAVALPSRSALSLAVSVDYAGTAAGRQDIWLSQVARRFADEIAPARTFALQSELEQLRAEGLARGGGAENAFTVGPQGYSGPLRFADEVVRHKTLDLLGDLSLCGCRLQAQVVAVRPGHRLNVALARAVREALERPAGRAPASASD